MSEREPVEPHKGDKRFQRRAKLAKWLGARNRANPG
jgi:hypothetical protein